MMTIGQVARRAGIRPSTLRYYETIGVLPPAARVSGQRRYDASVVLRLAAIDVAKQAGFTMREIRKLSSGFSAGAAIRARWRKFALRKLPEVEALLARAQTMKKLLEEGLSCGCPRLDQCELLHKHARAYRNLRRNTLRTA